MSRLYLYCAICSRRKADGLISGAAWGRFEVPHDTEIALAHRGTVLRACPTCVQAHIDWQEQLMTSVGFSSNGFRPTA